jgi:hypothetical protein
MLPYPDFIVFTLFESTVAPHCRWCQNLPQKSVAKAAISLRRNRAPPPYGAGEQHVQRNMSLRRYRRRLQLRHKPARGSPVCTQR